MWTVPTAPTRWRMHANHREEVDCIYTGEIGGAVGLKDTTTGETLKMHVEFEEGQDPKSVMTAVRDNCKKVEDDCEVFL